MILFILGFGLGVCFGVFCVVLIEQAAARTKWM